MKYLFPLFLFVISMLTAAAQNSSDLEGSHDHPMVTRLNDYIIGEFEQNFDQEEIQISGERTKNIEGDKTYLYYYFNENIDKKHPSPFQIVKNHENALKRIGGKLLYHDGEGDATFLVTDKKQEVWVKLHAANSGAVYYLTVIEVNNMVQEVSASDMYKTITTQGFVSLSINFETNKSTISGESQQIIEQIAKMLLENSDLSVGVEGHTDNTGDILANKVLSDDRAKKVVESLVEKGVSATRLKHKGWGAEKPIATNDTDEGRAKNRRVEIIRL